MKNTWLCGNIVPVPVPSLVVVRGFLVFDVNNVVVAASVGIGGS